MANPQVADGGMASNMEGSCELKLPLMFTANRVIKRRSEMKSLFFWNVVWP
jgi:hypothetical protein